MRKIFFYLACFFWCIGFLAHVISATGYDLTGSIPFIWVLHIVTMIIIFAAIMIREEDEKLESDENSSSSDEWNLFGAFKHAPAWLLILVIVGFMYAIVNFTLVVPTLPGTPKIIDGQYVLTSRLGSDIITEQQYHFYQALALRGFSGHWIAGFGIAAAMLFPKKLTEKK